MTWSDFKTLVLNNLDVDATRRGVSALRTAHIKNAVIDLKHFVAFFQDGTAEAEYADDAVVRFNPFANKAAEGVAMYVKSKFARTIDKDLAMMDSYWKDYLRIRRELIREAQEILLKPRISVSVGYVTTVDLQLTKNGCPLDLTDLEAAIFRVSEYCGEDSLFDKTLAAGVEAIEGRECSGWIRVTIAKTDTEDLLGFYGFGLQLTIDEEVVVPDNKGAFEVTCAVVPAP
jgi:hypothetical protein